MEHEVRNHFLVFYGAVVTLVVFSLLLLKRKPAQPTRLNLKRGKAPSGRAAAQEGPVHAGGAEVYEEDFEPSVRVLGVMFNYNGHSWEAYEALGLPAGSSVPDVQKAYEKICSELSARGDEEFFKAAYRAIMQAR